jgi:hypothetical protein
MYIFNGKVTDNFPAYKEGEIFYRIAFAKWTSSTHQEKKLSVDLL